MAIRPKFRPWKSWGLPIFQAYACNCNPRRTLPEIYPLFLVCNPSLKLSTWQEVIAFYWTLCQDFQLFFLIGGPAFTFNSGSPTSVHKTCCICFPWPSYFLIIYCNHSLSSLWVSKCLFIPIKTFKERK